MLKKKAKINEKIIWIILIGIGFFVLWRYPMTFIPYLHTTPTTIKEKLILPLFTIYQDGDICCDNECNSVCSGDFESCKSLCAADVCYSDYPVWCDTGWCGSSEGYCENWRNSRDKSCDIDSDSCCAFSGDIYQYNTHICCPSTAPYHKQGTNECYASYQTGVDNYYTRSSDCNPFLDCMCAGYPGCSACLPENCEFYSSLKCEEYGERFVFRWKDYGVIVGKCGVECISEDCDGFNSINCVNYQKINSGIVVGECGVECLTDICEGFKFVACNNYKINGASIHAFSIENSQSGFFVGKCGVECLESSCSGKDYITCENYIQINKGPIISKCGVECINNSTNLGYICVNNKWVNQQDYLSGNYGNAQNYYRFKDNSCVLVRLSIDKLTPYDYLDLGECQSNLKNIITFAQSNKTTKTNQTIIIPPEKKEPFDKTKIYSSLFVLLIIGAIIFYLWREYGKKIK